MFKRLIKTSSVGWFVTLAIVVGLTDSASAEPWIPDFPYSDSSSTFVVTESYQLGEGSKIWRHDYDPKTGGSFGHVCPALAGYCSEKIALNGERDPSRSVKSTISADLVMGVCTSASQEFCIESVRVYAKGEKPTNAGLLGEVDTLPTKGNKKLGLPVGGAASNWISRSKDPRVANLSVSAYVWASFGNSKDGFQITDMNALITPYEEVEGPYPKTGLEKWDTKSGWTASIPVGHCAWSEEGVCGKIIDSPENVMYGITFRINKGQVSFFNGRLSDPTIKVKKLSGDRRRVSIDASPVVVNGLAITLPSNSKLAKQLTPHKEAPGENASPGTNMVNSFYFDLVADWFQLSASKLKDTSPGQRSWWRLSSRQSFGPCWNGTGEISGIVTTNATAYSDGVPDFKSGFLSYRTAGLHFNPDGTEALGTYDLVLRSDVARCLYGFSKAPVYGTVSVSGEGDSKIATTVVGEKDGWINISAKGFTFSKKTIKVKLTQKRR